MSLFIYIKIQFDTGFILRTIRAYTYTQIVRSQKRKYLLYNPKITKVLQFIYVISFYNIVGVINFETTSVGITGKKNLKCFELARAVADIVVSVV